MIGKYKPHAAFAGGIGIAAALVMHFEGKSNTAYSDPPGVQTICFGHARGVKAGDKATDLKCNQYLKEDLDIADAAVKRLVKVPITDEQWGAFADFVYNEGSGTFAKSSILLDLNAGRTKQACLDLLKYVYAGGKKLPGLVKRRQAEFELCMVGVK